MADGPSEFLGFADGNPHSICGISTHSARRTRSRQRSQRRPSKEYSRALLELVLVGLPLLVGHVDDAGATGQSALRMKHALAGKDTEGNRVAAAKLRRALGTVAKPNLGRGRAHHGRARGQLAGRRRGVRLGLGIVPSVVSLDRVGESRRLAAAGRQGRNSVGRERLLARAGGLVNRDGVGSGARHLVQLLGLLRRRRRSDAVLLVDTISGGSLNLDASLVGNSDRVVARAEGRGGREKDGVGLDGSGHGGGAGGGCGRDCSDEAKALSSCGRR